MATVDIDDGVHLNVCDWHLYQLNLNTADYAVFHIPFLYQTEFESQVHSALDTHNVVAVLCSELHDSTVAFIQRNQHPKIKYFTCGKIKDVDTSQWMDWFVTTTEFYKNSTILDQLNPSQPKDKSFDILLGQRRPHRDIVYDYVQTHQLNDQVIMSYVKDHTQPLANQGFISDLNIGNITQTISHVDYQGYSMSLSQVIPVDIYNQTAYSLVAETNASNDYNFYTEKIVKPILAERLFLAVAGQHYLKNLQRMGFRTFDSVLDESYDNVADDIVRFNLVCEQMLRLTRMPQTVILDRIKPIVKHNREVMLGTDWLGDFHQKLRTALMHSK
jgi:hypothetical protein